jgi:hypothetical protein
MSRGARRGPGCESGRIEVVGCWGYEVGEPEVVEVEVEVDPLWWGGETVRLGLVTARLSCQSRLSCTRRRELRPFGGLFPGISCWGRGEVCEICARSSAAADDADSCSVNMLDSVLIETLPNIAY